MHHVLIHYVQLSHAVDAEVAAVASSSVVAPQAAGAAIQQQRPQPKKKRNPPKRQPSASSSSSAAAPPSSSSSSSASEDEINDDGTISEREEQRECVVCCEKRDLWGLGSCNHSDVCYLCVLRLRVLHRDRRCPICKQESENLVITPHRGALYDSVMGGPKDGKLQLDRVWQIWMQGKAAQKALRDLRHPRCTECLRAQPEGMNFRYKHLKELQAHAREEHHLHFWYVSHLFLSLCACI